MALPHTNARSLPDELSKGLLRDCAGLVLRRRARPPQHLKRLLPREVTSLLDHVHKLTHVEVTIPRVAALGAYQGLERFVGNRVHDGLDPRCLRQGLRGSVWQLEERWRDLLLLSALRAYEAAQPWSRTQHVHRQHELAQPASRVLFELPHPDLFRQRRGCRRWHGHSLGLRTVCSCMGLAAPEPVKLQGLGCRSSLSRVLLQQSVAELACIAGHSIQSHLTATALCCVAGLARKQAREHQVEETACRPHIAGLQLLVGLSNLP
mmetsp:Transcript_11694/g.27483  ORF Transcript_11694/g.27483 Transcript_11694/m.27483 type:complete len:264 (+) Transcript_11694:78-869(+)